MNEDINNANNNPLGNNENNFNVGQPTEQNPLSQEDNKKSGSGKWLKTLAVLIIVVAILYFFGFWGWVSKLAGKSETNSQNSEKVETVEQLSINNNEVKQEAESSLPKVNKGKVSLVISAGVDQGYVLTKGVDTPNVEITKIYLHNPAKDSWLLVYDGIRPLDLNRLSASQKIHELISTSLAAISYDKLRIEYSDLVAIDERGEQKIAKQQSIDIAADISIKENKNNIVNVWFDTKNPDQPYPAKVLMAQ